MRSRLLPTILISAAATLPACQNVSPQQRVLLAQGEDAYARQRYTAAVMHLTQYIDDVGHQPAAARAHYVRGMSRAFLGERAHAYADLEHAVQLADQPDIAWRAHAVLGVLHFEDQDWTAAAQAFKNAITTMPAVPPMDALLYRQGLCLERGGRWPASKAAYRRITETFPSGRYAELARRRLQLDADHFAIQAGVFSSAQRAAERAEELDAAGLTAFVRQEMRGDENYHVVRVGRFDSYDEAIGMLARVRTFVPDAQVWP
jgi:tetratricopeptide (TPR) repeat protein